MIQRGICILCLALSMVGFSNRSFAQKGKSEFTVDYGYYSFYSFLNVGLNANTHYSNSSGTGVITYRYYLTKDVTLGMGIGYENISTYGSFVTFAPELTVSYIDMRQSEVRVKLYGSFSAGVVAFGDGHIGYGHTDESGLKPWAFQVTPIGMRIGRQIAGFVELGYGYKGIFDAGLAVRFPKYLQHKEPKAD